MKKAILTALILFVFLFCLQSCAPATSRDEYNALQSSLDNAQRKIDELTENLAALRADYEDLQANYENLLERLKQSTLKNPTWLELKEFLRQDDTDELPYIEGNFDCTGFAVTLRDRAYRCGIRCAFVEVGFSEGSGHALNAFETTDKGLIYVDNTKADQIAYVEINQLYGTVYLGGVKSEYITCSGSPAEFYGLLNYGTHSSLFSYDYYLDYKRRREFYEESVEAYNKAVDEYNKGSTKWSYSQLTTWLDNLEALEEDLGSVFYEPAAVVESVEVYWN